MAMLNYAFIASSAVKALRYDEEAQLLEITFPSGATYHYFNVPPDLVYFFSLADSLGKFFNAEIKHRFAYVRVG